MENITGNIATSETLSGEFYKSEATFNKIKEQIFAKSWQWVADKSEIENKNDLFPFTFLENVLDEPLLLTNNGKTKQCVSNVCTHRGKVLVEEKTNKPLISCGYHGRIFDNDGTFKRMPKFEGIENFPRENECLAKIPLEEAFNMYFISLEPSLGFSDAIKPMIDRLSFLPLDSMEYKPELSKTYEVNANWALYVDNYLEGFHVPYIHPSLGEALDFGKYEYELFEKCNLQIGIAKENEPVFDLPSSHQDYGKNVYAYYFWLFPNMMFNFYPWGMSLNYIKPTSYNTTEVIFRTYQFKDTKFNFEDNNIDITELEDEEVVESVQKGIQSRFYTAGRFSPSMEQCVHHFHRLVKEATK